MAMDNKHGSVGTYYEWLPPIKSWPFDHVVLQDRATMEKHLRHSSAYTVMWLFDHVVLPDGIDNLKPLYLHYHSSYDHQTWQRADLISGSYR